MYKATAFITAFSFLVFSLAFALSAIALKSDALWVQLCASGQFIKIDLDDDSPPPPSHKAKACHALCCRDEDNEES